jgi:2,3-bisphosphoglycerate-dependent phosphoglycerate mutase
MKTIYLVRHCKTSGQEPDAPLTPKGLEQAERLAAFLAGRGIERIVSSPYRRAVQSIEPFARQSGLTLETDERVRERTLTTEPITDWIPTIRAAFHDINLRYPGGETGVEVRERALAAIADVLAHPASVTAVVSHGGWSSSLLNHHDPAFGFDQWQAMTNPDVFRLTFDEEGVLQERVRVWEC